MSNIDNILDKQREYFLSGETVDVNFRIRMLKKLQNVIKTNEEEIIEALRLDLNKHRLETYMCEIAMVYREIDYMLKNIKKLSAPKYRKFSMVQFGSRSYTQNCPYGNVLIVSPWNYPFMLTFDPLVHAIATGNTAIVKPSAYSVNSSKLICKLISETFDEKYIACTTGGRKENENLFDKHFDFVFFTGSSAVGKIVAQKCAEKLTPMILELGGKSPCVVDSSVSDISTVAKRIVFGKLINAGQTCVAPDYVLCSNSVKQKLIDAIIDEIKTQYGEDTFNNTFGKMINRKHFDRVISLIEKDKVVYGGNYDEKTLIIQPTVMDGVSLEDPVMQEEIFGPVLPIIGVDSMDEAISTVRSMAKPLALYLFSEQKSVIDYFTTRVSYGGGCVNDTIMHLATSEMGFGGVGESGMGAYHGKVGFDTFSHIKSIVDKKTFMDLPMRYQPYDRKINGKLLKMFLR